VLTGVSEVHIASIFRVEKISSARNQRENRWQAKTLVNTQWTTQRYIPEDAILDYYVILRKLLDSICKLEQGPKCHRFAYSRCDIPQNIFVKDQLYPGRTSVKCMRLEVFMGVKMHIVVFLL
jgi:hypothetical protein